MNKISTEQNRGVGIYLDKRIRLIIKDNERYQPRDGILKDFDDYNYYLEMLYGARAGQVIAFHRDTVIRIEPLRGDESG